MRVKACGGLNGEGDTRRAYRVGEAEQMRIFGCGRERGKREGSGRIREGRERFGREAGDEKGEQDEERE